MATKTKFAAELGAAGGPVRDVVRVLAQFQMVKGIVCFGSRAMGVADAQSDVDLYVLCQPKLPAARRREKAFSSLAGLADLELDYPGGDRQWWPQQDKFRLNGIGFDVAYNTVSRVATVVRKVKRGRPSVPELRFRAHTMLALLEHCIVLYDPKLLVGQMRANLYPYPSRLRERLVSESLTSLEGGLDSLRDYASRRVGLTAFQFQLAFLNCDLRTLLFAVNEKYDPVTKRVEQDLARLALLPRDFHARYARILTGPFDAAGQARTVKEYGDLIREVEAMIGRGQKGDGE